MEAVDPLDGVPVRVGSHLQPVAGVDPPDDQNALLGFDFADHVGAETTVPGGDVARFQRAPERSGQSPAGGCDDVVEGGGVGFVGAVGQFVVLGDLVVDTEGDRLFLGGQPRVA